MQRTRYPIIVNLFNFDLEHVFVFWNSFHSSSQDNLVEPFELLIMLTHSPSNCKTVWYLLGQGDVCAIIILNNLYVFWVFSWWYSWSDTCVQGRKEIENVVNRILYDSMHVHSVEIMDHSYFLWLLGRRWWRVGVIYSWFEVTNYICNFREQCATNIRIIQGKIPVAMYLSVRLYSVCENEEAVYFLERRQ